ncbi:hypothetical protein D3C75_1243260 [compost metagenome]
MRAKSLLKKMFKMMDVIATFAESRLVHYFPVERNVRFNPCKHYLFQCLSHAADGLRSRRPMCENFANKGVIVRWHAIP